MPGLLDAIEISSKGLSVQRARMNTVAQNIANAETTETEKGGPYRKQRVIIREDKNSGTFSTHINEARTKLAATHGRHLGGHTVKVGRTAEVSGTGMEIAEDPASNYRLVHDPSHPSANEDGYVRMPDIEVVTEMVDMMAAARAYEANTVAISSAKQMAKNALEI